MSPLKTLAAVLAAALVCGCAASPYSPTPQQDSGVATGAIAGGILGALLGGRGTGNKVAGAVVGAAAGGIIGGAVGASLDERDRQMAYAAQMQALETGQPGAPVAWRSEHTAYYGNIVPGPYYYSGALRCRQYSHTIFVNGQPQTVRGTACRNPDGSWTPVS
jgi:surface antigen